MEEYKVIDTEIRGNIYIIRNTQYNNLNAMNVTVANDVKVRLYGVIKGKLIIRKGARVYLHGKLEGKLENLGGEIHIFSKD
jgi:hypothetical protein